MQTLEVDAILFDIDGTLIDERFSYREAIRRTAQYLLAEPVSMEEIEEIKLVPGFNNDWDATWAVVGRRLHGRILAPAAADRGSYAYRRLQDVFQTYYLGDRLWQELSGHEPPFRWEDPLIARETLLVALEQLRGLSGFKLGIVTSRPRGEALMALRLHGLDELFREEAIIALEDAPFEKPHPAPLLELVRRLQSLQPVYVGDSVNDALAAHGAGMPFIHVGTQALTEEIEALVHARIPRANQVVELCVLLEGIA